MHEECEKEKTVDMRYKDNTQNFVCEKSSTKKDKTVHAY